MKSATVFALLLLVVATLYQGAEAVVEVAETKPAVPEAPLVVDFGKLENIEGLTKERLAQFRQALEAFKAKIEATRMNKQHQEAVNQEAMKRLAERVSRLRKTPAVEA